MKNVLLSSFLLLSFFCGHAQSTVGLIAHWDMNGSANDVSGNGHNGNLNNVTPATGMSGLPNTAYYFNGTNSVITVPYAPSLNLSYYTLCAKVKVEGFWEGTCQGNVIFERGDAASHQPGSYSIAFDDNPHDSDCFAFDSTQETFYSGGPLTPPFYADNYYTPTISEGIWYSIIFTFNDTSFSTYVNGVLKYTAPITTPGVPIGSSTDSISIGANIYGMLASTDQEYYKGYIDDIILYNRVLTDSEIITYSSACGSITAEPSSETVLLGNNSTFSVSTTMPSPTYQWQENSGSGFVNLVSVPPYSGVTTNTLTITTATMVLNNTHYRCIISNSSCSDTSNVALLTVHNNAAVNSLDNNTLVSVFPNPANEKVSIQIPFSYAAGSYTLINDIGQTIFSDNLNGISTTVTTNSLTAGVYILKIQTDGAIFYRKILKN